MKTPISSRLTMMTVLWSRLLLFLLSSKTESYQPVSLVTVPRSSFTPTGKRFGTSLSARRRTMILEEVGSKLGSTDDANQKNDRIKIPESSFLATSTAALLVSAPPAAWAASETPSWDPSTFQPVCPASDVFYRFLQNSAELVIGSENAQEYSPLIAGGLLRVRLELCVVESFFNEAVGPFIAKNGYSWILPFHETVETFVAGTIFAFAATFILIGSTKIITVLVTYTDFLLGFPSRLFGGFFFDRALGKPVTLDVGLGPFKTRLIGPPEEEEKQKLEIVGRGPIQLLILVISGIVKLFGQLVKVVRDVSDFLDLFVGRYLVIWATGYVIIKFLHFKVFPDFPNLDLPSVDSLTF